MIKDLYICKYDKDVAEYIGGFVVRKLEKDMKCSTCTTGMRTSLKPDTKSLTSIKDNGGLIYLQPDIAKVFVIAEKQMSQKLTLQNALEDKFFLERNTAQIQRACMDLIPTLSERFDEHFSASFKKMVQIYVSTRCKFFCKDTNTEMKRNQTCQKLNRIVLFRHL